MRARIQGLIAWLDALSHDLSSGDCVEDSPVSCALALTGAVSCFPVVRLPLKVSDDISTFSISRHARPGLDLRAVCYSIFRTFQVCCNARANNRPPRPAASAMADFGFPPPLPNRGQHVPICSLAHPQQESWLSLLCSAYLDTVSRTAIRA